MDTKIREELYDPLVEGKLHYLIPDFKIEIPSKGSVEAAALLSAEERKFRFESHFLTPQVPGALQPDFSKRVYTREDCFTIGGQINAEIAFRCNDVFPPFGGTSRSRGTSTVVLHSSRLHLVPESLDAMDGCEINELFGKKADNKESSDDSFRAHIIFHGPKLYIRNAGSKTVNENDFLGEAASSSFDTHLFEDECYKGALIQREKELHLHLHSKEKSPCPAELTGFVDSIVRATAFTLGFHPWPLYYELRKNYRVQARWLSPRLDLKQTYLAPLSESLWFGLREKKEEALHKIIPVIADGLRKLPTASRERLEQLLWHIRSSEFGDVGRPIQMLIVCTVLESLAKLIAGVQEDEKSRQAQDVWKEAIEKLGLSWTRWGQKHFELWREHRNHLAHGWVYLTDEDSSEFGDAHPRLGCAFNLMVAAFCGYRGHLMTNPIKDEACRISDLFA